MQPEQNNNTQGIPGVPVPTSALTTPPTTNPAVAPAPTPTTPTNLQEVKGAAVDPFANLQALTKPRDLAWDNWAKFPEIGTEVSGYIKDVFFRPEEQVGANTMKAQRGITLEQKDGTLVNVGIKAISFILAQTDDLRLGDPLKIVFTKTMPPQQKMYSPTKVFSFYGKNLPQNEKNPTVKELTDLDMSTGGTKSAAPTSVEDDMHLPAAEEGTAAGKQAF